MFHQILAIFLHFSKFDIEYRYKYMSKVEHVILSSGVTVDSRVTSDRRQKSTTTYNITPPAAIALNFYG